MSDRDFDEVWSQIESLAEQYGIKIDMSLVDRDHPAEAFAVLWTATWEWARANPRATCNNRQSRSLPRLKNK
jgi:hypothetical protein